MCFTVGRFNFRCWFLLFASFAQLCRAGTAVVLHDTYGTGAQQRDVHPAAVTVGGAGGAGREFCQRSIRQRRVAPSFLQDAPLWEVKEEGDRGEGGGEGGRERRDRDRHRDGDGERIHTHTHTYKHINRSRTPTPMTPSPSSRSKKPCSRSAGRS